MNDAISEAIKEFHLSLQLPTAQRDYRQRQIFHEFGEKVRDATAREYGGDWHIECSFDEHDRIPGVEVEKRRAG